MVAPTPALAAILDALEFAPRFALVLAVGPAHYPCLALTSLWERLTSAGEEVLWHADGSLDATKAFAEARSERPVVLLSGTEELSPEARLECFARVNLQRDVWGQYPVRIVLWCAPDDLELLQRAAPDLWHWRSLLQPLVPVDVPVLGPLGYLAWTVDVGRERSDDRVLRGGTVAMRDPPVFEFDAAKRTARDVGVFSEWVLSRRRGILVRGAAADPRYPARGLAANLAARRLRGEPVPFPVVIGSGELDALFTMKLSLGEVPFVGEGWTLVGSEDLLVFIIDEGGEVDRWSATLDAQPGAWIVVTDRGAAWSSAWPRAVAGAALDPLMLRGDHDRMLMALQALLATLFDPTTLQRVVALRLGDEASAGLVAEGARRESEGQVLFGMPEGTGGLAMVAAELLLHRGAVDGMFFELLEALRPRQWREIRSVRDGFVALADRG